MLLFKVNKKERQKREQFEPLHRSFMEFTAAFYLKSLSEKNQQDKIGKDIEALFENNSDSTENILTFALEMLAPDNACSDILTRIPKYAKKVVTKDSIVTIGGRQVTVCSDKDIRYNMDQTARMRLLQTAGYTSQNIGSVLLGLLT